MLLLSGLNLERVRVNEYRNAFGIVEAAIIAAPTTATESWYGCPVTSPVKRRLALISQIEQTGSVAARNIAVAAQSHVMQHLTASQSLQSAADPFVQESVTGSVYVRYMQQPAAKDRRSCAANQYCGATARLALAAGTEPAQRGERADHRVGYD